MPAPVLLLHGWAGSFSDTWRGSDLVAALERAGRRIIGVDLLGHGDAPRPRDPSSYVDLTQQLIDALPDEPVDAIAFSLGGSVLLCAAVERPDAFRRIVLAGVGESAFRDDVTVRARIADIVEGLAAPVGPLDEALQRLARTPGNDPSALASVLRHARTHVTADELAAVTSPTLVVLGDLDHGAPGEPLVEALPHARLMVLRDTNHFQLPDSPQFVEAAARFIAET